TPITFAQQRVGEEGRSLDANNRVGSGGYNSGGISGNLIPGPTGNQIVTGNVTGGREFRGGVQYTDPHEFRGNVAGQDFDRFIAGSSGAPQPFSGQNMVNNNFQPFYAQRLATAPPRACVPQGVPGTFVAANTAAATGGAASPLTYRPGAH